MVMLTTQDLPTSCNLIKLMKQAVSGFRMKDSQTTICLYLFSFPISLFGKEEGIEARPKYDHHRDQTHRNLEFRRNSILRTPDRESGKTRKLLSKKLISKP
jgi:hypothetical protein